MGTRAAPTWGWGQSVNKLREDGSGSLWGACDPAEYWAGAGRRVSWAPPSQDMCDALWLEVQTWELPSHRQHVQPGLPQAWGPYRLGEPHQGQGMFLRLFFFPRSLRGSEQSCRSQDRALRRGSSPEKQATSTGATGCQGNVGCFLNSTREVVISSLCSSSLG